MCAGVHLVISFCFLKLMHRPVDAASALAPLRGRYGFRLALLVWYSLIIFSVGYLNVLGKVTRGDMYEDDHLPGETVRAWELAALGLT